MCRHFHVANQLSALLALPFIPPSMWTSSRFNGGTRLRSLGKLCRGYVQVFLASPFHVRILTRKSIQHQEKNTKELKNRINKNTPVRNRGLLAGGTGVSLNLLSELRGQCSSRCCQDFQCNSITGKSQPQIENSASKKNNTWHDFHISRVARYTKKIKPREITYRKPQK